MAELRLTVVDKKIRRVTHYHGFTGPILVASHNPKTMTEYAREHDKLAGFPLYSEQRVSEKYLAKISDKDALLHKLAICETPICTFSRKSKKISLYFGS
jgi:hypothetical protein